MTWFDELGLAYARRYAELSEARAVFEEQKSRIEQHLIDCIRAEQPSLPAPKTESGIWTSFYVVGEYKKARERVGRSGPSSLGFVLGSLPGAGLDGELAFVPFVYFGMGKWMQKRVPPDAIASLTRVASSGLVLSPGVIRFGDEDFRLDRLEDAVRGLPKLFAELDGKCATAVLGSSED